MVMTIERGRVPPRGAVRLKDYRARRQFKKTPEPRGKVAAARPRALFVIQKHAARHLHYDFRLEADGVLKSWAVPKGPSLDPVQKRLAVMVEDHPLDYARFEGNIPQGEYGGGSVMIWDLGWYYNLRQVSMAQAVDEGLLDIMLEGKKMRGNFALVRMRVGEKNWLLIKKQDDYADIARDPVATESSSVLTGRSMQEIAIDAPVKLHPARRRKRKPEAKRVSHKAYGSAK